MDKYIPVVTWISVLKCLQWHLANGGHMTSVIISKCNHYDTDNIWGVFSPCQSIVRDFHILFYLNPQQPCGTNTTISSIL